ncbi:MAG: hypothetical protein C4330_11820 [Chitinophagaceae bacterium]
MKKRIILIGTTALLTAAGITLYLLRRQKKSKQWKRSIAISDAGYETAGDLLYPLRSRRLRRSLDN